MQAEHIIIGCLITGFIAFWGGFFVRKSAEIPAYSRCEIDAMQLGLRDRLDATDERLERIETKVDRLLQNGRGHAS
jgi:hypothetical protein